MRLASERNRLMTVGKNFRSGSKCPLCSHTMTDTEFQAFKADTLQRLADVNKKGAEVQAQFKELMELDRKAEDKYQSRIGYGLSCHH